MSEKGVIGKDIEMMAIRTMQHNMVFYTGTMSAEQLCSAEAKMRIRPDIYRHETNDEGYQRIPTSARVRDFARYIGDNRQSPTSIIMNARNAELKFRPFQGTPNFGVLTVPPEGNLYVVDGQHRLEGLRYLFEEKEKSGAKLNFEFPVVITNMSKYDEALQFAIINRTQKGLRTELVDLVLRKISQNEDPLRTQKLPRIIAKDIGWKSVAMAITDNLKNCDAWKGRLQEPNDRKGPLSVVTVSAMVSSLEPVVNKFNVSLNQVGVVAETLGKYWEAVGDLCPISLRQDPRASVLMKTLGLGVMHLLFVDIIRLVQDFHEDRRDRETFREILATAGQYMTDAFWKEASVYGSGMSSVSNVYRLVKDPILASYEGRQAAQRTVF